jgi:hypothetical protein
MSRLLICGSRSWDDYALILSILKSIDLAHVEAVMQGCARGADFLATNIILTFGYNEYRLLSFPANWARYGSGAGPLRNQLMLEVGKPTHCIAFDVGGTRGTRDMIARCNKANVPVFICSPDTPVSRFLDWKREHGLK